MVKKLQKHGNSLALVIEKPILEALGIGVDDPVEVTLSGKSLIVTRVGNPIQADEAVAVLNDLRPTYGNMLKNLAG